MARLWDEEERYQKGIEEIRALREEKKTGPMFNNENYDEIPEQQREHKEEFEADLEAKVKEQEEVLEDWGWKEKDGRWQKKNAPFKKMEKRFDRKEKFVYGKKGFKKLQKHILRDKTKVHNSIKTDVTKQIKKRNKQLNRYKSFEQYKKPAFVSSLHIVAQKELKSYKEDRKKKLELARTFLAQRKEFWEKKTKNVHKPTVSKIRMVEVERRMERLENPAKYHYTMRRRKQNA